jgi:hypothetical protein
MNYFIFKKINISLIQFCFHTRKHNFCLASQKIFAVVYNTDTRESSYELDAVPNTQLLCHLGGFCWKAKEPSKVRYCVTYN